MKKNIDTPSVQVEGTLREVRVYKEDSGWCVLNFISSNGGRFAAAGVVGDRARLTNGIDYTLNGQWRQHPTYGNQFKFESICAALPIGENQVRLYIEKHCNGLGRKMSQDIWDAFGPDAIKILKSDPSRVAKTVKRLSIEQAQNYARVLMEHENNESVWSELMALFVGHRIGEKTIENCISVLGKDAADKIRNNAFVMLESRISRVGFRMADAIFLANGGDKKDPVRQLWCVRHIIASQATGSTWMSLQDLEQEFFKQMLGREGVCFPDALNCCIENQWAIYDDSTKLVAFTPDATVEKALADEIRRLLVRKKGVPIIMTEIQEAKPLSDPRKRRIQV